jgi:tRNA A37 threonylcarbamoyladenosine biosynthesis protein TsaE
MDAYFEHRLASLLGEGLIERLDDQHIVIVEWAENVLDWLPPEGLDLHLSPDQKLFREIQVQCHGSRAEKLLTHFSRSLAEIGIPVEPDLA